MKLFLDFDGVIADTVDAVCELYRQDFALYDKYQAVQPHEINTWKFKECSLLPEGLLHQYFKQHRFFDVLKPMDAFCNRHIDLLEQMYDLSICTVGDSQNIKGKKIWLDLYLMPTTLYELIPVDPDDGGKSKVDMSDGILVDDRADNLRTSNASIKICFGEVKGWNSDWNGLRCKDWKELMELLEYIYKFEEE